MIGKTISHYKILEKLGGGGMGVVYKAEDTKLKRSVALKFLPPSFSFDDDAKQRFIHEAQAASALEHNNICNIHEINETEDGRIYIVMSCYEGETLKQKIESGPLIIDEAIDIVIQIAEGLSKAHEKNIIHRDIKPANIFSTNDSVVKILDFGLAKVTGKTQLTKMGSTVGTIAYMSPEQTRGEQVDHRTDIWSLGVVLYEMVGGERPFKGDYEQAVIYSILNEEPQEISSLRSDVPKGIISVIGKALQKDCRYRYQTMKEFIADLKSGRASTIELPEQEKSIAVLPFINDSPDEENAYFINGIMEEILNNLQKIKDLRVISRTSVEQYRNQVKSLTEIAKELDVNYIVEGSGQKYGNTFRLRTQLIMAAKEESHIWGESFQQEINDVKDIFRIQSQIAEAIAKELKAFITPQEKQLIEKIPTKNLEAYDAFLKGQFYWRKLTPKDLDIAMQYFEMAKEKDQDYALAYAGICDVWIGRQQMGFSAPDEAGPKGMEAVMKALKLDSTIAEVHYTLALMKMAVMWDWQGSESEYKKTIELNPNHAQAHAFYSHLLNMVGRPKEAMEQIELALSLDPYNPLLLSLYSADLMFVRRYDDAIIAARDALIMDPTAPVALTMLAQALYLTEKYEESLELVKKVWVSLYGNSEFGQVIDQGYAKEGYAGALNQGADKLLAQSKKTYINPFEITLLYLMAGNKEQALKCTEKAYEVRDPNLPYLLFPIYDSLREEPRFQEIARKMNLPFK